MTASLGAVVLLVALAACGDKGGGDGDDDGGNDAASGSDSGGGADGSVDAPAGAGAEVFVTSRSASSLMVFPATASGSPAPARTVAGGFSGIIQPTDVAVAPVRGEVFVGNDGNDTIAVHPVGAQGNVSPLRTLSLGEDFLSGIAVDEVNGELYVAIDGPPSSVKVFAIDASGSAAPLRTISGAATRITVAVDVALSPVTGEIMVLDVPPVAEGTSFGRVLVWDRGAGGDLAPKRWFQSNAGNSRSLVVDSVNGEIVVLNGPCDCSSEVHAITAGTPSGGAGALLRSYQLGAYGSSLDAAAGELVIATSGGYQVARPTNGSALRAVTVGGGTQQCWGVDLRPGD